MSQGNLKKNYVYQLLYEFVRFGTPLITAPYISRILGVEGVGVYSYTASILAYFSMFASLGTSSYGARTIAQSRDDKAKMSKNFWEIEVMSILTSLASITAWLCWSLCSKELKIYFLALTPHLFASMFNIVWFYKGLEKVGYVVRRDMIFKFLGILYLFVFVKTEEDLIPYIFANAIISMLGSLSMWIYLPRTVMKINWKSLSLYHHFKETIVYFIPTISISIYTVLDRTLIGVITNDVRQNGYYEQAHKILKMMKAVVITSFNSVMTVRSSYLFSVGKIDEIKRRIDHSLNYILFLGFGAVFGMCGIAVNFVPLFFGEGFEPVISLLYFKTPLVLIIGVSNCLGALYYTPSGRRKDSTKYIITGSFVNLIINMILIPIYGMYGAVVATLIAEMSITILYLKNCRGFMKPQRIWQVSWRRVLAGIGVFATVVGIRQVVPIGPILLLCIQMVFGIGIYFILLYLLRDSLVDEVLSACRKFIRKKK